MSSTFGQWLRTELADRGWSRSEAARRGNISAAAIDQVINGASAPGLVFCRGVAQAFDLKLEDVLRLAGILPPSLSTPAVTPGDLSARLHTLPPGQQAAVVSALLALLDALAPTTKLQSSAASSASSPTTRTHTRPPLRPPLAPPPDLAEDAEFVAFLAMLNELEPEDRESFLRAANITFGVSASSSSSIPVHTRRRRALR